MRHATRFVSALTASAAIMVSMPMMAPAATYRHCIRYKTYHKHGKTYHRCSRYSKH